MRTKTIQLYQFTELDDTAKERARQWYREGALDYDWWEYLYDDAKGVGLDITEFDLDRSKHVNGKLTMTVEDSIAAILKEHGKACETYRMAQQFQKGLNLLEKDGLLSDECVDESIVANEYEFTETGKPV